MGKLRIKFNGGNLAILCSKCSVIIKEGYEFNDDELKCARGEKKLPPAYCGKCNKNK